jgi:hypothetical protein
MKSNILLQLPLSHSETKCGILAILISVCAMSSAQAVDCGHPLSISHDRVHAQLKRQNDNLFRLLEYSSDISSEAMPL